MSGGSKPPVRINGERLWDTLMVMGKIGGTPKGGCCRLALTDLDKESRDLWVKWCKDEGCTIRVDKMGNVFARRAGEDDSLAPVMTGSHIDTQPTGGKFDGVYGVMAGLEVIRTLNENNIKTKHPIEATIWTNEEGSRFAPAMVSSGVFAGVYSLDYGHSRADVEGKTMGEELERIGYLGPDDVNVTSNYPNGIHAFFEVHIEQGPILEDNKIPVGVVTHGQGQRWYELTFSGVESHAGPTPMHSRKDALLGAAKMIQRVNEIGMSHQPYACATVGMCNPYPNSRNVIPGKAFITLDIRHPEDHILEKMDAQLRAAIDDISNEIGLTAELEQIFYYAPVPFDKDCVNSVRAAAVSLGYDHQDIVSGAGHDACYLNRVCPSSMVFVPCVDGISHNEAEHAHPEWITAGGDVLFHAMVDRAIVVT